MTSKYTGLHKLFTWPCVYSSHLLFAILMHPTLSQSHLRLAILLSPPSLPELWIFIHALPSDWNANPSSSVNFTNAWAAMKFHRKRCLLFHLLQPLLLGSLVYCNSPQCFHCVWRDLPMYDNYIVPWRCVSYFPSSLWAP